MPSQISTAAAIQKALRALADPIGAQQAARFFKTGPGQYGEGDIFWGLAVPDQRKIAKQYLDIPLNELEILLNNKIHEQRLTALHILVYQYAKADEKTKKKIYTFYLKNIKRINNWDLVDTSARDIVGAHMITHPGERKKLYHLVKSKNLWERRIAIIASFAFIREKDFTDTLKLSELLLRDPEDLMHKAVGWMLREVGKRDVTVLTKFLQKHKANLPRTTLRYAIEHFPPEIRKSYLVS